MDVSECQEFAALPHFETAIALRRIDDAAKQPGLNVPDLLSYRKLAEAVADRIRSRTPAT